MNNSIILNYLQQKGYNTVSTDYYNFIEKWENWWKNTVKAHKYHDSSGKERTMHTMGMAKRLSEDWASIVLSERDEIKSIAKNKTQTAKNNKYLEKTAEELNLYDELHEAVEKSAAMGTAGAVLRVTHVKLENNKIVPTKRTKKDIIYLYASQIVPLKVEHGKIIDVAFVSENIVKGKKEYYIERHEKVWDEKLEIDKYVIKNTYLNEDGNEIVKKGILKSYSFNSDIPLFSICKTPIANPLEIDYKTNGMGYSMYGNAEDQLFACDITYHNFVMDFFLGGKKMFYNKKIVGKKTKIVDKKEVTEDVYPDDIMRQQWATYGDEQANFKNEPVITEYNPELRVEEDTKGIQFCLDLLSFKAGLGMKYYQFNADGTITATQYVGDRQDLVKNAKKYRKNVNSFVANICKGLLLLGRVLFNEQVTEDCDIEVIDQDGFLVDTETAKEEFRKDIAQGIRQPWEFRVKFLGEDEETAKKMVAGEDIEDIEEEEDEDEKDSKKSKKKQSKEDKKEE